MSVGLDSLKAEALVAAIADLHLAEVQCHVLKDKAEVVAVLKVVQKLDTVEAALGIQALQLLEDFKLTQTGLVPDTRVK